MHVINHFIERQVVYSAYLADFESGMNVIWYMRSFK